jgi:oxygen-independent coproporphyrinogen-3 oxidase
MSARADTIPAALAGGEALNELLQGSPFRAYTYAYPHKTAYRRFVEAIPLARVWQDEQRNALFLYIHVPFCEMRCGFCNLFTRTNPESDLVSAYLDALARQVGAVRDALGEVRFARFAMGGGTPTYLEAGQLERVFDLAESMLGDRLTVPASVETSPDTADWERLAVLRQRGVTRISIGVQSFLESETRAVARPQQPSSVRAALERIRSLNFPVLNIDLMYGLPGQSVESWLDSLRSALRYHPEELFLYPLYVRPQTGLGQSRRSWDDLRLSCYREAVALLSAAGYEQLSMRMFRAGHCPPDDGPVYCCQDDGMVGLGCGARSYTRALHHADEYAVKQSSVETILTEYCGRSAEDFASVDHGYHLDGDEQRRRYVLLTLLQSSGLSLHDYRGRFGSDLLDDLPRMADLEAEGLALVSGERLVLSARGLELSDIFGPWLSSREVRRRMREYAWR